MKIQFLFKVYKVAEGEKGGGEGGGEGNVLMAVCIIVPTNVSIDRVFS